MTWIKPGPKTGWPPGLLQDDHKGLSQWFASRPNARWLCPPTRTGD